MHFQRVMFARAHHFHGHADLVDFFLQSLNGCAGRNAPHDGHTDTAVIIGRRRRGVGARRGGKTGRHAVRQFDDVERARAMGKALDKPTLFKRCYQPMDT